MPRWTDGEESWDDISTFHPDYLAGVLREIDEDESIELTEWEIQFINDIAFRHYDEAAEDYGEYPEDEFTDAQIAKCVEILVAKGFLQQHGG